MLTNTLRPSLEGFGGTTLLSPSADFAAWIETRNNESVLVGARITMAQGVVAFVGDPAVIASGDVYTPYGVVASTHGFVVPYATGTSPTVLRAALATADGMPADDVELAPESELINLDVASDGAGTLMLGLWRDQLAVGARRSYVRLIDDPMDPPDGASAGPDAGSPDADAPAGMDSGGGCCQSSHGTPDGAVWAMALALVLVRRRRR